MRYETTAASVILQKRDFKRDYEFPRKWWGMGEELTKRETIRKSFNIISRYQFFTIFNLKKKKKKRTQIAPIILCIATLLPLCTFSQNNSMIVSRDRGVISVDTEMLLRGRDSLKVARLVWDLSRSLRSYTVLFFVFCYLFFFSGLPALHIKMQDKPSAAGRTLPQPSAELQVSICKRNGRCSEAVASTSCTPRYRLFNAAQPRGFQTIVCNRLATDLWISIYSAKRRDNFSGLKVERWKRSGNAEMRTHSFDSRLKNTSCSLLVRKPKKMSRTCSRLP